MPDSLIVSASAFLTVVSHVVLGFFVLGLLLRVSWVLRIRQYIAVHALSASFIIALSGVLGSLLYSEVLGFEPCVLCWIQRIFLYPQVVLLAVALYLKESRMTTYLTALTIPGGLVALYHAYTNMGGTSLLPCTAQGGACSTLYVWEYGYITIPMMACTVFVYLLVIELCRWYEYKKK